VRAVLHLGSLTPEDVAVELFLGRLNAAGELVETTTIPMQAAGGGGGRYLFDVTTSCPRSGLHGYTVRVRPNHADLAVPFLPGLIVWADATRGAAHMAG
jgi:glycogen phosphorylase